jgi:hypothetical protein
MATPEATRMSVIVSDHAKLLKGLGFRKRRHSFNRTRSDGLVHVVYFWMAPKEPPAWTEVPGLRERRYGSFRLDFGVYLPEMTRNHTPRSDWINEYDCHLRRTIGQLLPGQPNDMWWRLDDDRSSDIAGHALREYGLPWLDRFPDRVSVLQECERVGPLPLGLSPAGWLDIADVYRALGDRAAERRTLERYISGSVLPGHAEYLADYLQGHGHGDLINRIQVRD